MAKAHIQKEVHLRPQLASFWQMLAQYLLHHTPDGTQVAATCGQAAQNLQAHSGQVRTKLIQIPQDANFKT